MKFVFENIDKFENCHNETEKIKNSGLTRITTSPYVTHLKMCLVHAQSLKIGPPSYWQKDDAYDFVEFFDKKQKITFHSIDENIDGFYIIPLGVSESPKEWMSDFYDGNENNFKNIFNNLPKKYYKDLQSGKAFLMIDNSFEGYHSDDIFDYLYESAISRYISPENIIYVTGNLIVEDRLKLWKTKNKGKLPIRVIPYPHFESDIGMKLWQYKKHDGSPIPTTVTHEQHKNSLSHDNVKIYNFLNKKPRNHRLWFYSILQKWNLLDKGIISMNPKENDNEILIDFNTLSTPDIKEANKTLPIYAYNDNTNDKDFSYYMYNFNQKACLDSWISIISETHFDDDQGTIFLSEKTFKTIACQSPFLILGNRGSLKKLKELGYITFHDIIDESYDDLESVHRMNSIVDEIRKWESNPDKFIHFSWLYPILEHNIEVMKFNSMFKEPAGFSMLVNITK